MKRTIPMIRDRLYELSDALGIPELAVMADETKREYCGRKAPTRRKSPDAIVSSQIRAYARAHPTASQQEIADVFGCNPGRVSEALNHKR